MLRFQEIAGDIPCKYWFRELLYVPQHNKLVASNNWEIFCIDPTDGSHTVLLETDTEHAISCIHPHTGDIIYSLWGNEWENPNFFSISPTTGDICSMALIVGSTDLNTEPFRLLVTESSEQIVFGFDVDSNDQEIMKIDASGRYVFRIAEEGPIRLPGWQDGAVNRRGVFFTQGEAMCAWLFEEEGVMQLAGSLTISGNRDGVGIHSRFTDLRCPSVNETCLFARAWDPDNWKWRYVRMDLDTLRVETLSVLGLDPHDHWLLHCASAKEIFALRPHPVYEWKAQLFKAPLEEDSAVAPGLALAVGSLDLLAQVRPVSFHLRCGGPLHFDRRLLVTRSAYFRDMLSSGLREDTTGDIDLSEDLDADEASLTVLLRFVLSDGWEGAEDDPDLCFRVRALADRYRLARLVALAESRLFRLLKSANVLSFLGRTFGSGSPLEAACWAILDANGRAAMEESEEQLDQLISQNPQLAKRLLLRFSNPGRYIWTHRHGHCQDLDACCSPGRFIDI